MNSLSLPFVDILSCMAVGSALCVLYLILLWQSIKNLSKTKHKALFLIASTILRVSLFLILAIFFSGHSPVRFLCIFVGFILTRFLIVGFVKVRGHK